MLGWNLFPRATGPACRISLRRVGLGDRNEGFSPAARDRWAKEENPNETGNDSDGGAVLGSRFADDGANDLDSNGTPNSQTNDAANHAVDDEAKHAVGDQAYHAVDDEANHAINDEHNFPECRQGGGAPSD
jgi:hypothetical protein